MENWRGNLYILGIRIFDMDYTKAPADQNSCVMPEKRLFIFID